ncbi:hypothetical protein GALL_326510 [mine drainage metagenome]|uniref:Uncharacterized protein n=1 Tax=mine drainage metagenome TaxID=410659 RepID=A0A1J5QQ57_9ZZZZ
MTLAELLVYSVLLLVVVAITGTMLVRGLLVQRDVGDLTSASNGGQVVLTSIEGALRNASTVATPSAFGGRLLIVKTRTGDDGAAASSWTCTGWLLDTTTQELLTVSGASGPGSPTVGLTTGSDFSSWHAVLTGVTPTRKAGVDQPIFSAEGATGAQVLFDVLEGASNSRVTFGTAAIPRPQGTGIGGGACT